MPLRQDRAGKPFWCDADGFTSRDFKVVTIAGTWIGATVWIGYLLMTGQATELHLKFYANISQVQMVLIGGMAAQQFGSMWGGGGYGNSYGGGYDYGAQGASVMPSHEADEGGDAA